MELLTPLGKVYALEALMKLQDQVECKVIHHFSKGVYAREVHIPAGTIVTGEIHKFTNLNILSKGRIQVLVGDIIQEVEAPFTVVSPPGTKRVARALTDCVWTTIHGTDEVDLNIIEHTFTAKSEQEWLEFCGHSQLALGFE
jgi:hypothetical protein